MTSKNKHRQPKLFLTKTWGFDPERYPTLGFSNEGSRENFLRQAAHGDWIVIVGTRQEPTMPEERGRLLGMCQVGHEKVDADAIMREMGVQLSPDELDMEGRYRWRWAMPITKAKLFDGKPDLQETLGSNLPGLVWAAYVRDVEAELGAEAVQRLLALPVTLCPVARTPTLDKETAYAEAMALHKQYGSSGPPPSGSRSGSEHSIGAGYTYALILKGGKVGAIKIGSSRAPQERLAMLNKELRPALTGCSWSPILQQIFPSETLAYRFEQLLLRHFRSRLVPGEREIILVSPDELNEAWRQLFSSKDWALPLEVEEGGEVLEREACPA